jgi:hypothetical protein
MGLYQDIQTELELTQGLVPLRAFPKLSKSVEMVMGVLNMPTPILDTRVEHSSTMLEQDSRGLVSGGQGKGSV